MCSPLKLSVNMKFLLLSQLVVGPDSCIVEAAGILSYARQRRRRKFSIQLLHEKLAT